MRSVQPIEGTGDDIIFINSSAMRSWDIILIRDALRLIASNVSS